MLVEKLETTAEDKDWDFCYGKDHWQNLGDSKLDDQLPFDERKKYLKLLWKDRESKLDQYGTTTGYTFYGELLLLVRSKISDKDYEYKYKTHIKNLEALSEELKNDFDICDEFVIKRWRETEVENLYDQNMDGLKITFTIDYDE